MFEAFCWSYLGFSVALLVKDAVKGWKDSMAYACFDSKSVGHGIIYLWIIVAIFPVAVLYQVVTGFIRNRRNRSHA